MPYTGFYRIEAVGAAGGYGKNSNNGQYRGRGAKMVGNFSLSKGETIRILVGQEGGINHADYAAGGGGGTFVVRGSKTPLIVAGGGGGMEQAKSRYAGCDASTSTTGNPGHKSWSGGINGHGAQIADNDNSGKSCEHIQVNSVICQIFHKSSVWLRNLLPLRQLSIHKKRGENSVQFALTANSPQFHIRELLL